ncbi:MAG TPA: endonuclease/exonuclease/phosphatase family protein [Gammaproteobacteria bacterium]|nr:endonuclease/exonuclease/phosphatase family protein [Gammaproteobacteria bacterium]
MLAGRFRLVVLLVMLFFLAIGFSEGSRLKIISDDDTAVSELQSCEMTTEMNEPPMNTLGLDPESITFLNWNIYKGNGDNWRRDLSSLAQGHDLMTIQEAKLDDELIHLLEVNDFNWEMNTAFYLDGAPAGVMTAASVHAVHSCGFRVVEPFIRVPKSTLISYYEIDGYEGRLLVANIHGINFTLGIKAYREQLEKLYGAIKQHDGPMIVAGDFNSWSGDRLQEVRELIDRLALSDIDYPVNNKTHVFGNAIDHVFYRQLEVVSDRVLQVSSSDHNPISVNFRLQAELL